MKINKITTLCKARQTVNIFDTGEGNPQWIGDGRSGYLLAAMPEFDEETICTFLEVPEDKRNKWTVYCGPVPDDICIYDEDEGEQPANWLPFHIIKNSVELLPVLGDDHVYYIDVKYLAPVLDAKDKLSMWVRRDEQGYAYIVIKDGFLIQAYIIPAVVFYKDDAFVPSLQSLSDLTSIDYHAWLAKYGKPKDDAEPEQMDAIAGE
jgi:hypothetical protein